MQKAVDFLKKYKLAAIAASIGLLLLIFPLSTNSTEETDGEEGRLESVLQAAEGVGRVNTLLSDSGAVIVCEGADNADVRLTVIKATAAFTGFTTDRIQVLKMETEE